MKNKQTVLKTIWPFDIAKDRWGSVEWIKNESSWLQQQGNNALRMLKYHRLNRKNKIKEIRTTNNWPGVACGQRQLEAKFKLLTGDA